MKFYFNTELQLLWCGHSSCRKIKFLFATLRTPDACFLHPPPSSCFCPLGYLWAAPAEPSSGRCKTTFWLKVTNTTPFCSSHSRKSYLCELACFLLSTSSPEAAVGTSVWSGLFCPRLGCWVVSCSTAKGCWGRVQVHWAPAGRALTERWQHFTAPHKSASRFFSRSLWRLKMKLHSGTKLTRQSAIHCPRLLPTPAFATADSV